ncbi:glycosyltransferase [Paraburkholderia sp. T12-10]|nr:glycosyltransferase [Paraburkholderia sp. T12-10]
MATVSILVPASDAQFIGRALLSAQHQTLDDIEILVGDDTPNAALEPLVARLGDPRVRYFHHGFQNERRNARALWASANGRYVKWLVGDDLLMPTSVERLVDALRQHPESALAFHGRVLIDADDSVIHTPPLLLKVGERGLVDRELLIKEMVAGLNNFLGELSNVMVDRMHVDEADVFSYRSMELDYLGDVATFLNLSRREPLVAVGGYWSMSRQPAGQVDLEARPDFSAGLYEWEVFVRGEAATGALPASVLAETARRLEQLYAQHAGRFPEIARFLANLPELTSSPAQSLFDGQRFRSDLSYARSAVAERLSSAVRGAPVRREKPGAAALPAEGAKAAAPAVVRRDATATLQHHPIRLVCATRCAQEQFLTDTALGRSLAALRTPTMPELLLFEKNSAGLPTVYNSAIGQAASNPAILVFVHDDVSITDYFWMDRVHDALAQFDVVGLAGNRRRVPQQPAWAFASVAATEFKWDAPAFLSGTVGHGRGFPCENVSYFGPAGVECKLLDGLMLIADSARLLEAGVRFDEQFQFDLYDMDFCRQVELKGLRMGTWPISVVHQSGGKFGTPGWRASYERYLRKYGE